MNRQLESLNEPKNVVISCSQDGSMKITDRKGDNKDLEVIRSFADATGVSKKSKEMYQRAEELGLLDDRSREERRRDRMGEFAKRGKERDKEWKEFRNKQMEERNKDWAEHRELVKKLDEEERLRNKIILSVCGVCVVAGICGTVWLDRNTFSPVNGPDLERIKREGNIFMTGMLKWIILLGLVVIGLLFLPHIVSLSVYLIKRCWKSLKMSYESIRESFEDEDKEEDSSEKESKEDKDNKTD